MQPRNKHGSFQKNMHNKASFAIFREVVCKRPKTGPSFLPFGAVQSNSKTGNHLQPCVILAYACTHRGMQINQRYTFCVRDSAEQVRARSVLVIQVYRPRSGRLSANRILVQSPSLYSTWPGVGANWTDFDPQTLRRELGESSSYYFPVCPHTNHTGYVFRPYNRWHVGIRFSCCPSVRMCTNVHYYIQLYFTIVYGSLTQHRWINSAKRS